MSQSKVHKDWTISDFWRLIMPPIVQNKIIYDIADNGHSLQGFTTFGFFSDEALEGYKTGTRKIQIKDFNSGSNIVLVDAIALHNNGTKLMFKLRKRLIELGHKGKDIWFIRKYSDRRMVKKVML